MRFCPGAVEKKKPAKPGLPCTMGESYFNEEK
jgi:hypothetical protein